MRPSPRVMVIGLVASMALAATPRTPRAGFETSRLSRRYDPSRITLTSTAEGFHARWPGLTPLADPGRPALPVDRVTVRPPEGMRLAAVHAVLGDVRTLSAPGVPARYEPEGSPVPDVPTGAVFPAEAAELAGGGYLRGRRLDTVEIHPLRWRNGVLEAAAEVELELTYEADTDPGRLRPRPGTWESRDPFEAAAREAAVNGGAPDFPRLRPLVNGAEPFSPRFLPSDDGSPVRYLIITTDELAPDFQVLADWKTALGSPAVVRTLSWIYANYPRGVDHAEDLRNFIREAVQHWGVEYVLLGGDTEVLPFRYGKSYFHGGEFIPTDLYFMCLDGTWNSNGNDLFGEGYLNSSIPGDGADLYPDVWLGRAPVRNPSEASVFVRKVKDYETQAPLGPNFGETNLVLGEVFFPQNWSAGDTVIFDGAWVAETGISHMAGVSEYKMYENYTAYPGASPEYKTQVISRINSGYNLILHVGHGYRNTMSLGIDSGTLDNSDADQFVNGVRAGMIYAINCTSSSFDFDCIAEHLLRNPDGGVVASEGSSRLDFPATGWDYQDEFFHQVYEAGVTRMGQAVALQKLPFIPNSGKDSEHRWTQFSLNYMGDPDLDLYTGPVDTLHYVLNPPLELGVSSYTVTVTDSQGPVAGATVCLNKAGDSYGTALTDVSGIAAVDFRPDLPGTASLGLRAHDHRSRVDSLGVAAPAGPHLFADSLAVDDAAGGDGDGELAAGETAYLYPRISNQGSTAVTGVTVTVTGAPAGVTVLDSTASCGPVAPGASVPCADPIRIALDSSLPDESALGFTLHLTAGAYAVDDPLVLYSGAPGLKIAATAVRDTVGNGNGNGTIEANEDQHLRVYVRNLGLGASIGLTGALTSSDPAVQVTDGASGYGDVEPDSTSGGDGFGFRFTDSSLAHTFQFTLSDQRGTVLSRVLDLVAPGAPTGLTAQGGATDVQLRWTPVTGADLSGYNVYRGAAPAGPFVRVNAVPTGKVSYYRDEDLAQLTRYYYKVAAVDSSGNESGLSGVAQASTSLPPEPGFPMALAQSTSSSPCLAYIDGDKKAEVVTGSNEIYVAKANGEELLDGDEDSRTYGVFSRTGVGPYWAPPSVADIDRDGVPEIVAAGFSSGLLYVWSAHGGVKPGWPQALNLDNSSSPAVWGAAALADVDGDGKLEIFVNAGRYTMAFHSDGTELVDGDRDPSTKGVFLVMNASANYSTPAVSDLDGDGEPEIVVASRDGKIYVAHADGNELPGFPYNTNGDMTGSPAIGDLDRDGLKEIVVGTGALQVQALNMNGVQPPGWPQAANMNQDYDASPALADMDGDGFLDVILCAGNGTVYMWHGQNGQLFPGWGFVIHDASGAKVPLTSSPAIGNLDGDPGLEVCFGGSDGNVYGYNVDATPVDGFPIGTANGIDGGPLLWDIDDDGTTEVVVHSLDQNLYAWRSPGAFDPANQPWPMFHHDSRRSGAIEVPAWEVTGAPPGGVGATQLVLTPVFPNPASSRSTVAFRIPENATAGEDVDLTLFDASGRRVRTLARGRYLPGAHEATWDGTGADGRRAAAGVYFFRLKAGKERLTRKLVLIP